MFEHNTVNKQNKATTRDSHSLAYGTVEIIQSAVMWARILRSHPL